MFVTVTVGRFGRCRIASRFALNSIVENVFGNGVTDPFFKLEPDRVDKYGEPFNDRNAAYGSELRPTERNKRLFLPQISRVPIKASGTTYDLLLGSRWFVTSQDFWEQHIRIAVERRQISYRHRTVG
jgi:hypothetical protein